MGKLFRKFFWAINRRGASLMMKKKYNLKLHPEAAEMPEGPFIMVSNHANFFDPWIVAHYSKMPVSIMMNEEGFKASPITKWYLESIGAFRKRKGASDMKAMKTALKRLSQGYPLLIFPEGQTSWDGETQPIFAGIEKLIKRSKLPLVLCNLRGHFLSRPWWNKGGDRMGEVVLNRKVLSADEVKEYSNEELLNKIIEYIHTNDIKHPDNQKVAFTGTDVAMGLERVIWHCPACKKEDSLLIEGDSVTCTECNTKAVFSPNMTLTEKVGEVADLYDWVSEEKGIAKAAIAEKREILASDEMVSQIRVDYSGRVIMLDTGKYELFCDKLVFHGEDGEQVFETDKIVSPVFQNKDILEFEYEKSSYQFQIQKTAVYKWLMFLRYLTGYEVCEERGYM